MAIASKPAQEFVPIKEVRDNVVVLQDGSLHAILMTSSINFALQSEDNQAAIVSQFQNFLNTLDFSIQIFLQSRKMDIAPYLHLLEERYAAQETELMKMQTREYIEYVKTITDQTNIMTKTFFVVVPFGTFAASVASMKEGPLKMVGSFISKKPAASGGVENRDNFQENKIQLQQRVAVVEQGLIRCGLRTAHLGSEELVELFYRLFNPGETDKPIPLQA